MMRISTLVLAAAAAVLLYVPAFAQVANGGDALDWVCANEAWLKPLLVLVPVASFASAWTDRMPPWLAHIINFVGTNWGDIARAIASANPPPSASGKK